MVSNLLIWFECAAPTLCKKHMKDKGVKYTWHTRTMQHVVITFLSTVILQQEELPRVCFLFVFGWLVVLNVQS